MTLTVDASSPAAARGSGASTVTTGITPPGSALYVAFCQGDANNGSSDEDQTVVDSNSVTWTKKVLRNANGGAVVTVHYLRNTGGSPGANYTATLTDNKGSVAKSIFFQVFTDPASGIAPDIGATAVSGSASVSLTTTVANSWVWSCGLTANATLTAGTGCTLRDETGGFDSGDAVFTQSQTAVTSTPGTSVTNTINGTATVPHNVAIEIIPGTADNFAGPWTGPTPGRLGPTGQWTTQPLQVDSVTLVSLADAGSSAEALSASVTVPLADAGASAEALAVASTVPLGDTGASAEALAATAAVPLADAGASAEALAATATAPLADTGASTEALTATVTAQLADSGSSAEALSAAATISLADAGSSAEGLSVAVGAPLADAGSAAQALTVSATLPLSDAGAASDAVIAGIAITPSDAGSSTETVSVTVTAPLPEAGAGADVLTATATAAIADAGSSTEALTVVVTKLLTDSASAQDALSASPTNPEVVHDSMVMPVLNAALACLEAQGLAWPNAPSLFELRSGNSFVASADSAFDECCAGIAWVRLGTGWPTDDFPIQKVNVGFGPETDWAFQLEVGVQRCIPTEGDDGVYGSVVTRAQWQAAVQQEADDAMMLRKAMCCLRDTYHYVNGMPMGNAGIIIGIQTPLENSGPCGGIMLAATVRVPACDCPTV